MSETLNNTLSTPLIHPSHTETSHTRAAQIRMAYKPRGFFASADDPCTLGRTLGVGLDITGVFLAGRFDDFADGVFLAAELAGDLVDEPLPAVEDTADFDVLADDGRGLAEAVLDLTDGVDFGLDVSALGAGRVFCAAEGVAGVQVLAFFGALGAVTPLLPPVAVLLKPSGLAAV